MDAQWVSDLSRVFRCMDDDEGIDVNKACKIVQDNIKSIDFDDDDDVKEIVDILESALTKADSEHSQRDKDGKPYGEAGVQLLSFLISKGFDVNFKMEYRETLLLRLAESDVLPEIFQKVVDLGANAYAAKTTGENILNLASHRIIKDYGVLDYEKSERLPIYIAEHFDFDKLNRSDNYGFTPLMCAVETNKRKLVETLLKCGAEVDEAGGQAQLSTHNIDPYGVSPFALACRDGNAELAEMLIKSGADETLCDAEGTPAMFSVLFAPFGTEHDVKPDKKAIVSLLKNPDFLDSDGNTLLIKACISEEYSRSGKNVCPSNNGEIIAELLARDDVNVNAANNKGETALYKAAEAGAEDIVKMLIEAGAEINERDNDGNNPLMAACSANAERTACLLVRYGADFEAVNNDGKTAMDLAVKERFSDMIELCMSVADGTVKVNRVEVSVKKTAAERAPAKTAATVIHSERDRTDNKSNSKPYKKSDNKSDNKLTKKTSKAPVRSSEVSFESTPLALACLNGDFQTAKKLIASADETVCDACGLLPSFYLLLEPTGLDNKSAAVYDKVYQGKQDIVSVLKNVEAQDTEGNTLFMKALQKCVYPDGKNFDPVRNVNVITGLIMRGVNVNVVNKAGKRPIHYAAENLPSLFPMLIAMGADIDAQDGDGDTALITACRIGYEYDCTVLLSSGANYRIKNKKGETAKDFALKNRLQDVLEMME